MQAVNAKNQMCFVVWSDEIEGRLDPHFYKPEFREFTKKIRVLKYKTKHIKDLASVICGPFGSSIKVKDYRTSGVPLIRIANINESKELSSNNTIFISEELAKKLKSYKVKKNDLIISQRGTLGLIAKVSEFFDGGVISANFIAIKDLKDILPDYLKFFLSSEYGQKQLNRRMSGQVQTKITTDDIKSISVPIPPLQIQNQIVEIMESAYKQKAEKEQEAEELLNSIDDYVLDELGIKIPEIKDKMCFAVDSEEITNRLDSYYYQPKFKELENALEKNKYKLTEINQKLKVLTELEDVSKYDFIKYIDLASINKNFGIIENYKVLKSSEAPSRAKQKVKKGDLLLSSLQGSLKSIAVVEDNFDNLIASTGFYVIRKLENYNNYYLWAIFRSSIYQILLNRIATGAIMSAINIKDLKNLKIPLPPLEIQNKIAEEVKSRIEKAKKLKADAQNIIEAAKREVEKIILGK